MLKYDAEFSGSSGNAVLINDILFDIGINWKDDHFQNLVWKSKAIFISHRHSDHLNLSTYKWISKVRPNLQFFVNQDIIDFIHDRLPNQDTDNLILVEPGDEIRIDDEYIDVYKTTHEKDLLSNGYKGISSDLDKFIFATDFKKWEDLPNEEYDYFFIEANHDARYAKVLNDIAVLEDKSLPSWILHSSGRHTTKQDAFRFFQEHRMNKQSKFIPLHKSERFYDITDYIDELNELKESYK